MSRSTLDTALSLLPSLTGLSPFIAGLSSTVLLGSWISHAVRTPVCTHTGLGSFHFARRYFGNRIFSFSSSGYLDVSVHRVPGLHLWIQYRSHEVCSCRFPHSDIHGSRVICTSPWLFAAYHVFHRLSVPRHPPCALLRLTFICIALHTRALIRYFVLSTDLSVFCLLFITKTDCQLFGYLGCLNFYFYFLSIDSIEYLRLD